MNRYPSTVCDGEGFRDVAAATLDEQRELLVGDDPRKRVWAAWALGLRLEREFAPRLRELAAHEPVAGVRRHYLVILAGYDEVDIVAAFARNDRDERVRATAAQYVASLARTHAELFVVLDGLLADESAVVRAAAVRWMPDEAPDELRERAARLRESDEAVRSALHMPVERVAPPEEPAGPKRGELVPVATGEGDLH